MRLKHYEVCVIGAGVSGLKAAHMLINDRRSPYKVSDIAIFEAQDRLGGRIMTDRETSKLGFVYDLGAAWFHDFLSNEVLHEAVQDGSIIILEDGYFDNKVPNVYASELEGPVDVRECKLEPLLEEIYTFIKGELENDPEFNKLSIDDALGKYLDKYGFSLSEQQIYFSKRMIRYLELWVGVTTDVASAENGLMEHNGRNLYNKKGYDFIIQKLSRGIPSEQLHLSNPIEWINYRNSDNGYRVAMRTAEDNTIYCNYLIVSVPLSILSLPSGSPNSLTWAPQMPSRLYDITHKQHFGALGKVIFEFENVWWPDEEDHFIIFPEKTPAVLSKDLLSELPNPFSYFGFVINYNAVNPHIKKGGSLVLLTQSPLTEYLEANPSQAWTYFKPMLAKICVGHLTDPINVITSGWTRNPYIRGAYSVVEAGDEFEEPIRKLYCDQYSDGNAHVRFVGEHSAIDGNGCVHGAYMSSVREVSWIFRDHGIDLHA